MVFKDKSEFSSLTASLRAGHDLREQASSCDALPAPLPLKAALVRAGSRPGAKGIILSPWAAPCPFQSQRPLR